uniref:NADH dehydrogenase subunit 6 n=1 Tax=Nereis zonata TaxID=880888 RepID=A0A7M3UIX7_9ANNE|nr:NADH dehydrogenase subunit 6 [Nereis zonata]QOH99542.1 NADH dehydrogenase subunit 6 [Nereis zonata]
MTLLMMNSIIVTLFISCLSSISPISLGTVVLSTALFVATTLSILSTSWFGLITFIIYVGGMLVMFAYFAALQPNQQIINWTWIMLPITLITTIMIISGPNSLSWIPHMINTSELYQTNTYVIPVLMALILFLALIMVVKTSRADEGPLRPFS